MARAHVVAVLTATVLAVGCSSDEPAASPPLDDVDEPSTPVDEPDDPPDAPADDGDGGGGDEKPPPDDTEPPDDQLYPPLPESEPNPGSEVPVEDQEFFLELHAEAYALIEETLATNEYDRDELAALLVPAEADALVSSVERRIEDGTQFRSSDSEVRWVEVTDASGGEAVVQSCRVAGPLTGSYDVETGEKIEESESSARIVEFYMTAIDIERDVAYRVAGIRSGTDEERCGV